MIERFERLVDHMEWADARTLEMVRTTGDARARELLAHVLATERVWMSRIRTGDSSHLEIWPDLDLEACEAWRRENVAAYRRLLGSLDSGDVDEEIGYRNSSGVEFATPLGEILTHVALHGSHHRGQIARRVREVGGEPRNVDFIQYVREHP
jgi:uncharacterized damage-inducible protein DinB